MQDITNSFTIPEELVKYFNPDNALIEENLNFSSDIEVVRDSNGKISSLKLYSPDKELIKTLCYENSKIILVNHFRQNLLYSSDRYNNELLIEKTICYMKDYETEIKKVANKNKICDIIRKIEIVNKFIFLNKLNLNRDLFIDNFIISMGDYND